MTEATLALPSQEQGLVTIAIPTFNGARWLRDAIESAIAQTYPTIEILVVDDASDDRSTDVAASFDDGRVRVVRNEKRLGLAANWDRCIELARGEFVKFLFQDDLLDRDCVGQFVALMQESPSIGIAFSPRTIELEDPNDPGSQRWAARYGQVHLRLGPLARVNNGRTLFDRQMATDPFRNFIGEPSVVMLRTSIVRTLGGFDPHLHQLVDAEMWLRLMFHSDVGFIDRPLATFRVHRSSASARHRTTGADWLDPLWMVEGLLADDDIRAQRPGVARLRIKAVRRVLRSEAGRIVRRRLPATIARPSDIRRYLRHRFGRLGPTPRRPAQASGEVVARPDRHTVAAVIVTHHPQAGLLDRIGHLPTQVDAVVVVDNGSSADEIENILGPVRRAFVETILNDVNVGLATALNQGVRRAVERGYAWVLTLDQDTVPGPDLVTEAAKVFDAFRDSRPAVIGASYGPEPPVTSTDADPGHMTPVVFTAGALHSVAAWKAIGGFRDDYFIDSVDAEYCLRARSAEYAVLLSSRPMMTHAIGHPTRHRTILGSFSTSNHDSNRRYYMIRNRILTWRKYAKREPRYVLFEMRQTAKDLLKIVLVEDDRGGKLASLARGAIDGVRGKSGEHLA